MSEEEIIEILNNCKCLYLKEKIDSDILEQAIQGLLDLYNKEKLNSLNLSEQLNKEKEKNKELSWKYENAKDMYIIKDNSINENYISKDKIKTILNQGKTTINFNQEKIKKISEEIGYLVGSEGTVEQAELFEIMLKDYSTRIEITKSLQKLLEEE